LRKKKVFPIFFPIAEKFFPRKERKEKRKTAPALADERRQKARKKRERGGLPFLGRRVHRKRTFRSCDPDEIGIEREEVSLPSFFSGLKKEK